MPPLQQELENLRFALDESAIVATTDAHGVITAVNDTFCRIAGYTREELLGQTHRIINSGVHSKAFFQDMWRTIQAGRTWRGEVCNKTKKGSLYWVATTIVPFLDDTGTPLHYRAIRFDITHRKTVEAELTQLKDDLEVRIGQRTQALKEANDEMASLIMQLQAAEEQRERFVAALTHDMRTPLVGQQRALQILDSYKESLPERVQPFFKQMEHSNASLLGMVSRLLDVTHLESGTLELNLSKVVLANSIAESIEDVASLVEGHGAVIHVELSTDLPKARVDNELFQRLLINLLSNSLAHLPKSTGIITIETQIDPANQQWQLIVSDNGPGIAPEVLPTLFDRYRVSQTRKIGSGLGLSICKMIMTRHGGTIQVDGTMTHGARFIMTFPLHANDIEG